MTRPDPQSEQSSASAPLLRVEDLRIDIHGAGAVKHAVRGVDFTVERGKTLCIVGESGCGKSLTALSLLDLLPAAARRRARKLEFAGQEMAGLSDAALADIRGSRIAMIFQDPMTSLNPVFTIGTQLIDVLRRHNKNPHAAPSASCPPRGLSALGRPGGRKVSKSEATERALYLLKRVGIANAEARLRQYPFELSGGLRQRVMIAMALMCGPELLIADEPTTALDVTVQAELLALLRDIQAEFGLGMVFISHDMGLVSHIADDLIVMYAGDIVESGPVNEVLTRPQHPYTSMLLRCIPRPGQTAPRSALPTIAGVVPALENRPAGCSFQDRCPGAEARCREALPPPALSAHGHRCLCIKPGALTQEALS